MKLKETITLFGVIGLSNIAVLGMANVQQQESLNTEIQRVEQQIIEVKGGTYSIEEDVKSLNEDVKSLNEQVQTLSKELSELKKQPTCDSQSNDIECNVEQQPVNEKPVARTAPQTVQEKEKPKATTSNSNVKEVNVRVSFYTSLASENGGYAGMNAINGKLALGSISAPKSVPFGSTISIPDMQNYLGITEFTVDDRGGAIYIRDDGTYKLDVYVPKKQGESDSEYFNRVNNLGIVNTTAKIYFK